MSFENYLKYIKDLRDISVQLCEVGDILQVDLFNGPIGKLFDFAYNIMVPEGSPDEVYEEFGEFIFGDFLDESKLYNFFIRLFEGE